MNHILVHNFETRELENLARIKAQGYSKEWTLSHGVTDMQKKYNLVSLTQSTRFAINHFLL